VNSSGDARGVSTGSQIGFDGVQGNIAPEGAYAHDLADGKPKGANLTEDPNLTGKTVFGKIGTKNDPARVAEQEFAKKAAAQTGKSDYGDLAQGGDSKFSSLESSERAS